MWSCKSGVCKQVGGALGFFAKIATLTALIAGAFPLCAGSKPNSSPSLQECLCSAQQISKMFAAVAKTASPAVVYISAEGSTDTDEPLGGAPGMSPNSPFELFDDDFFNRFFGMPYKKSPRPHSVSQGSGFFVSADGHIMTNAHVVKGSEKIEIILHDGTKMPASLVGIDVSTDIAIIKVEGEQFPFLELGNSDDIEVAEWVVAIGSPFQLQASVTVGVVSAKGRQNLRISDFEDFIQTDAAINPGNSGGPLLDLEAKVIGINTAIVSKSGGYLGIGFAIPSNMARNIMDQIIHSGSVTRGFLGVSLQPLDQDMADAFGLEKPEGALVAEVLKDSPAEKGGLKQGDIIVSYNGIPVKSIGTFRNQVSLLPPGTKVTLSVNRNGTLLSLHVTLGSHSESSGIGGFIQKLGMEVEPLTPEMAKKLGFGPTEEGLVITKIKPGSAAASAGMRPGFLIVAVNHKPISTLEQFQQVLEESKKKGRVLILAKQGNMTRFYSLKIN